jgi:hypothetical protein
MRSTILNRLIDQRGVAMTLVAKKDFPPNDLKGLIAYVKANKDKINLANAGVGAASHLCGMLFMSAIQNRSDDDSLQRHGPGNERPPGRPGRLDVRPNHQHDKPDQSGKNQSVRHHKQEALGLAAKGANHG